MDNVFLSNEHEQRFSEAMKRTRHGKDNVEYGACLYILTSDRMYEHLEDCFDFHYNVIILEALLKPWQTGSSRRLTCLAYNLFTENTPLPDSITGEEKEDMLSIYSVAKIFWALDSYNTQIALNAISIHEGLVRL